MLLKIKYLAFTLLIGCSLFGCEASQSSQSPNSNSHGAYAESLPDKCKTIFQNNVDRDKEQAFILAENCRNREASSEIFETIFK